MADVFEDWNKGELDSFLIEITKDILRFDDTDGSYLCRVTLYYFLIYFMNKSFF